MARTSAASRCLAQAAHKRLDRLQKPLLAFAKKFVAIDTTNPPGRNYLACCEFLAEKLEAIGMRARILKVPRKQQLQWVPGSEDFPRYNVVARWDVGAKKTLHYTGHYDVVPATSGWVRPPFAGTVEKNRLYARGSSDMKGCDAAAIFAIQALKESDVTPPWNIECSFTADEETGGYAGLGYLVRSRAIKPDAAVLLEGARGEVINYGHRGVLWVQITVRGKPGHGSNPKNGINALEKACGLITRLKKLQRVYNKRKSAFLGQAVARKPTLMIGGVCFGGGKINTIPDRFSFSIDRRMIPEERLAQVKAELERAVVQAQRADPELRVDIDYPLYVESGWTDTKAGICQAAKAAHHSVTGKRSKFRITAGFTDMHFLTNDGKVPTVGYGVSGAGAHADDEYCDIPDMLKTAKIYAEIAMRMGR